MSILEGKEWRGWKEWTISFLVTFTTLMPCSSFRCVSGWGIWQPIAVVTTTSISLYTPPAFLWGFSWILANFCLSLIFIPVIVATKYLSHPGLVQLVEFGHPQVFLQIEVLLIFVPVLDEPRNVLEDHHMWRTNFLRLIQLAFQPGLVRFVFTDYVCRVRIKLRVQYEEGDTVLVKWEIVVAKRLLVPELL